MLEYQMNVLLAQVIGVVISFIMGKIVINKFYEKHHDRMGGD